jgi:general secretion pathway protein A
VYESFYKLKAKPFRLSPDPGYFFPSRGHKRALAYLRYGLSQGEGFVVITGSPGTGKTTLAQILLQEMGQSDVVVAHLTTTQLEADDMLRMVSASFGLRYEGLDKTGLLKNLEAFLLARSRERKRALLVIDEAQNLPARSIEELRMLSNLQVGDKALLQTFLLGQAQFRQMLEHPDLEQLRQRVIANYHLSSLALDECQSYIETRLKQAGWQGDPHFSPQVFALIHGYTEGIPRRINMLCDRALLFSALEEHHEVDEAVLHQVTEELQQEVSGHPVEPGTPGDLLANDLGSSEDSSRHRERSFEEEQQTSGESAMEAESPSGCEDTEAIDIHEGLEMTETVEELSGSNSLNPAPMQDEGGYPAPDASHLDRAEPDDSWQQPIPQRDKAESVPEAETPEPRKVEEIERFRVIPGGKGGGQASETVPTAAEAGPGQAADKVESEEVTERKILRLVLAYHRSPRSFPGLSDLRQPLPKGIRLILQLAVSDDQVLQNLRQISVMGISPAMLRAAVRFFVRRVLFLPGGDDYRVLGLQPDATLAEVELHYGFLMRLMRQEGTAKESDDGSVSRIGEAYERLCRGDITAPVEDDNEEPQSDVFNIDDIEELDIDLAPKIDGGKPRNLDIADIIDKDGGGKQSLRNIVLIAGACVIVFVLYLTQIRSVEEPAGESAVSSPAVSEPLPEMEVDSKPEAASVQAEEQQRATTENPEAAAEDELMEALPALAGNSSATGLADDPASNTTTQLQSPADDNTVAMISKGSGGEQAGASGDVSEDEEAALAERLRAKAEKIQAEVEARAKAEAAAMAKAKAEAEAREKARMAAEAKARAEAEARAKAEAAAKAKAEAEAREKARLAAEAKAREEAEARAKAEAAAKVREKARLAAEAKLKADLEAKKQAATTAKARQASAKPSLQELQDLMKRLQQAYRQGDIAAFTGLFSPTARTNDQTSLSGIRADYQQLFSTSEERELTMASMVWEKEQNYARGLGEYEVTIHSKGSPGIKRSKGKATVQVERRNSGELQITRFYFEAAPVITESALNGLMQTFRQAYEQGDIDQFMNIFSPDAQTNDRATVAGIREDYVSLFKSTAQRSLELKDIKWDIDGDKKARGEAKFTVAIKAKADQQNPAVYKGTLWIEVQDRQGNPLVTHFAFVQ